MSMYLYTFIDGPVGLRWRVTNVKNAAEDQEKVIRLLASIQGILGGKEDEWQFAPLAGPSGQCPQHLADAIWEFQVRWKQMGIFKNIDGVVDPGGNTLRQLNFLAMANMYRNG